ncbi:MAG: hypothetical protein GXX96_03620 [Planctomycetaceae bacterium]|nr:hypothetical protein [Planctomycetaceae bacterium]
MILRSRRKPPTTAQNTWATTSRLHSPVCSAAIVLAAAILIAGFGHAALAGDEPVKTADFTADQNGSGVEQASYTVSQTGHRYKWMPYQPKQTTQKVEPLRADAAQFTMPVPPPTGSQTPHPLDDPFGDRQQAEAPPALPDVQQLLVDDTDKKTLADDLLGPQPISSEPTDRKPAEPPAIDLGETNGKKPDVEGFIVDRRREHTQECQDPDDILYPIDKLDHNTAIRDSSIDPQNRPRTCDLGGGDFAPRQWAPTTFMWQASGLCHKPAYFEDVHLERYGHSWGPYVQPLMSGAHFFLNVPILPYKMGLYPPNECIYTLGYYRPGSCAPYMLDPLPLSIRAALAEGGAAVGMAYLIP